MSNQTLTSNDFSDEVLDTEAYVLGDNAAETLKALWGLGDVDLDEQMSGISDDRAHLSLDTSLLDLSDTDSSMERPDWLSELEQATPSSAPDLDF